MQKKSHSHALIASILFCFLMQFGHSQSDVLRTFDASCQSVCNGSVELLQFQVKPERFYYWSSNTDGKYHSLTDPILENLCPGKYRIRKVDIVYQDQKTEVLNDSLDRTFHGLNSFSFSSLGKRDLSLYVALDGEINHINFYMKAMYSTDEGKTWNSSTQFHQKILQELGGGQKIYYLINFPRSTNDKEKILLRVFRRKSDAENGEKAVKIKSSFLESKEIEEYTFQIGTLANIHINSTVSNEVEGGDGYISLDVEGGTPPYEFFWENEETGNTRSNITAGNYHVLVTDFKSCTEESSFKILAPEGAEATGEFTLAQRDTTPSFNLEIKNLYRQPIDLVFNSTDSVEVKRFKINPLYEDLNMVLDLSFLDKGAYTATLSTVGYSKNVAIEIE